MNADQLDAIKARLAAITPGQWTHERKYAWGQEWWAIKLPGWSKPVDFPLDDNSKANTTLIAHAPDDMRALLAQHDADQQRIAALEAALREIIELRTRDHVHFLAPAVEIARAALQGGDETPGESGAAEEQRMKVITLRYHYVRADGEPMMYLCRAQLGPRDTLRDIKADIKCVLEQKNGGPITDLQLVAQNDPVDVALLMAQEE